MFAPALHGLAFWIGLIGTSIALSDFSIDLIGQILQLPLREPERGGLVAQNAPGGPFDSLPQFAETLTGSAG